MGKVLQFKPKQRIVSKPEDLQEAETHAKSVAKGLKDAFSKKQRDAILRELEQE